jgi:hypothetical protein
MAIKISANSQSNNLAKADAFKVGTALVLTIGAVALTTIAFNSGIIPMTYLPWVVSGEILIMGSLPLGMFLIDKIKDKIFVKAASFSGDLVVEDPYYLPGTPIVDGKLPSSTTTTNLTDWISSKFNSKEVTAYFTAYVNTNLRDLVTNIEITANKLPKELVINFLDQIFKLNNDELEKLSKLNNDELEKLSKLNKDELEKLLQKSPEIITSFAKSLSDIENMPTKFQELASDSFQTVEGFEIRDAFLRDMLGKQKIEIGDKHFEYRKDLNDENYKTIIKEIFTKNFEIFKNDKNLIRTLSSILNQGFPAPILEKSLSNNFSLMNGTNGGKFSIKKTNYNTFSITFEQDFKLQYLPEDDSPQDFATSKLRSEFTLSKKAGTWVPSEITSKLENIQML